MTSKLGMQLGTQHWACCHRAGRLATSQAGQAWGTTQAELAEEPLVPFWQASLHSWHLGVVWGVSHPMLLQVASLQAESTTATGSSGRGSSRGRLERHDHGHATSCGRCRSSGGSSAGRGTCHTGSRGGAGGGGRGLLGRGSGRGGGRGNGSLGHWDGLRKRDKGSRNGLRFESTSKGLPNVEVGVALMGTLPPPIAFLCCQAWLVPAALPLVPWPTCTSWMGSLAMATGMTTLGITAACTTGVG